jgi:replication-associated recombination protein RarA
VLEPLTEAQITALLRRALEDRERGLGSLELTADDDALKLIAGYSSGDCRNAYNTLEVAAQLAQERSASSSASINRDSSRRDSSTTRSPQSEPGLVSGHDLSRAVRTAKNDGALAPAEKPDSEGGGSTEEGGGFNPRIKPTESTRALAPEASSSKVTKHIDRALAATAVQQRVLMYDKSGEEHYNLISALHKSVRNSDPDAALYWLARIFAAGEDPLYLARRVVRMAVEDIGLAAPEALNLTLSAKEAIDFLGSPEGDLALAEAVVYLSLAPKSNSVYTAYGAVQQEIEQTRQEPVPLHLRNAPTRLMKELGYGKGYLYAHNEEGRVAEMDCLPDSLRGRSYYHPTQEGREKQLAQRMEEIRRIRSAKRDKA